MGWSRTTIHRTELSYRWYRRRGVLHLPRSHTKVHGRRTTIRHTSCSSRRWTRSNPKLRARLWIEPPCGEWPWILGSLRLALKYDESSLQRRFPWVVQRCSRQHLGRPQQTGTYLMEDCGTGQGQQGLPHKDDRWRQALWHGSKRRLVRQCLHGNRRRKAWSVPVHRHIHFRTWNCQLGLEVRGFRGIYGL